MKKRRSNPPGAYPRLTQPLVRDNGVLRPASWDEALDPRRRGVSSAICRSMDGMRRGIFSCSKSTNEVQLPGVEIRPVGVRQQQRRQLANRNLTRS